MSPRILHVAALPFPSHQGTQAALFSMLEHSARAGRDAALLTYAADAQHESCAPTFALHRARSLPKLSPKRSGPTLGKLVLDLQLGLELARVERRFAPQVIVAHHVEAASVALAFGRAPVVFFAHTDLRVELPTYAPRTMAPLLSHTGALLDARLAASADAVAVISPLLLERFARHLGKSNAGVRYVPTPWLAQPPRSAGDRARARAELGIAERAHVLGYAGNLDRYQGLDTLLSATRKLVARKREVTLVVATESDTSELRAQAHAAGIAGRLRFAPLAGEQARRTVHAAADVAVVPRLSPGGLPIKLLDALARGVACVAVPRATAGLALDQTVALAPRDDDPDALAAAVDRVLHAPALRAELERAGARYIAAQHSPVHFLAALDAVVAQALHPRAAPFHVPETAAS